MIHPVHIEAIRHKIMRDYGGGTHWWCVVCDTNGAKKFKTYENKGGVTVSATCECGVKELTRIALPETIYGK